VIADIGGAHTLQTFHVDRSGEPRVESSRPATVVDTRALRLRNGRDATRDLAHGIVDETSEGFGALALAGERADRPDRYRHAVECAVEQHVRNAYLLLHAIRERRERRRDGSVVDDQVRLRGEHDLHTGCTAAASQPPSVGRSTYFCATYGRSAARNDVVQPRSASGATANTSTNAGSPAAYTRVRAPVHRRYVRRRRRSA